MDPQMSENRPSTTKVEFAVKMKSPCCASKVESALKNIPGILSIKVDAASQRLVVEGDVSASTVQSAIESKTGMSTVLLGHGSTQANLGAGVAAISIGSSNVKGLLRFVQSDPNTCVIEGTIDQLPTSEPVYLSLHETGDVSDGCQSCGPPVSHNGKPRGLLSRFLSLSNQQCNGVLGQLHPSKDNRADFRMATKDFQLSDMYGHCVVIHKGDLKDVQQNKSERLACGIIARSSGLFENSKRFCACDGVSIWEQRSMDRAEASL